ncbi:hypothetical protein C5B42_04275 [Candidatus Cerribacteria bacterium 'Amazon FNV 2010 28 9']|uniref:DNA ligase n=1 Tax=Candidatus Cerribacteria bacterium 'Amazon FNV 2010 28 9' TaxID=2081795 RepID=A0A317JQT5_9BACT|nr:MAG: hypothetical protein C5B42_04275 [Candidatus Cerribacteria bacterium 'Amazon FNV 2010 28 9']
MTISSFSKVLETIEQTTLRNQITQELAKLFNELDKDEIEPACWLLLGRIVPPYEGIEFQFAEKMMIRAIAEALQIAPEKVTREYKKEGDLAKVAQSQFSISNLQFSRQHHSVEDVYAKLKQLALENGEGSQERKIAIVVELLKQLDPVSVKFVVRIILTKLRLGFSDMTILDALSWSVQGDKSDRPLLEEAYQNKHDIGKLAKQYIGLKMKGKGSSELLKEFTVELGIPIQPALCQRLKTAQEMIDKMGKIVAESKYDGTRVQIHIKNSKFKIQNSKEWKVRTFTRSLEESSNQFPELSEAITHFGHHDIILDCEAVGFDPKTGKLLAFQETIQRKRKHGVEEMSQKIPLRFFVFDVLYKDGKSLLSIPLAERKKNLHDLFEELHTNTKETIFVESAFIVTESADELRTFHTQQLANGLEGAVIKQYESVYQPGRKGWSWVKFKEEEGTAAKLSDTIDAVVMGYWYGKGKRNQFGIGAFLIGIQGKNEEILTLSKVGTGLSDEQWKELKGRCEKEVSASQPKQYLVDKLLIPDVWVSPAIVVEVAGDELTKSPNHSAGLALRFPRLVKFRDDKSVKDITTQKELSSIR